MLGCLRFCIAHICTIHQLRVCSDLIPILRRYVFLQLFLFTLTFHHWLGFLDTQEVASGDFTVSLHYKRLIADSAKLEWLLHLLIKVVIKVRLFREHIHACCELASTAHELSQVFDFLLRSLQYSLGCICTSFWQQGLRLLLFTQWVAV